MKILLYEPYSHYIPHFGTALEIAEGFIRNGHEVVFIGCDGKIPSCDVNVKHKKTRCLKCKSIRNRGYRLLSKPFIEHDTLFLTEKDHIKLKEVKTSFSSLEELRLYNFENFDIGYAVMSTIISEYRDPNFDVYENTKIVSNLCLSAAKVFFSLKNYISKYNPDQVYLFNGRISLLRGVLRYCQSKNIQCFVHERGSSYDKYELYENDMPHSIKLFEGNTHKAWVSEQNEKLKEKIASDFYISRKKGKDQSWFSFTKHQMKHSLPENWDKNKKNIVIFDSSEDEFVAINDEWTLKLYPSQYQGIKEILQSLINETDCHIYLRMHPNLIGINNESTKLLRGLAQKNFTIIEPESPIDTYELLEASDVIITFGSTVGIEAAYWGKPSILLGPSFYTTLNSTYNPHNHDETISLLKQDLKPKNKEGAIKYGYYFNSFGENFKFYNPDNFQEGSFNGKKLRPNLIVDKLFKLYSLFKTI